MGVHAVYAVKAGNRAGGSARMRLAIDIGKDSNADAKPNANATVLVLANGQLRIPPSMRQLALTHRGQRPIALVWQGAQSPSPLGTQDTSPLAA